jgi:probable phosphoglycerate mutase
MHVYLVRHGETFLARRGIHQSPNTPLSPKGKEQAENVSEVLRAVNPDIIVSSSYTRAVETARVLSLHTGAEVVVDPLYGEIMRPSSLYHKPLVSLGTLRYVVMSYLRRNKPHKRYQDAETYAELCARARRAQKHIEALAPRYGTIIVVSHTVFIRILLAVLCTRSMPCTLEMIAIFFGIIRMPYTGVVHLVYEPTRPGSKTCAWRIVSA